MSKIGPLNELLNRISNFKITGLLKVLGAYEPDFSATDDDLIYRFESAEIQNILVDNISPNNVLQQFIKLKKQALSVIHKEIDIRTDPLLKARIYNDVLFDINTAADIVQNKMPDILLVNKEEIHYIGTPNFRQIERNKYKLIINHILKSTLFPLRDELVRELNILQKNVSHIVGLSSDLIHSGSKSTNKTHLNNAKVEVSPKESYIIDVGKIQVIYQGLVDNNVISDITLHEFISCFNKEIVPSKLPTYLYKQGMIYVLSLLKVSGKIAHSNFGVKDFHQVKAGGIPNSKRELRNKIKNLIG